MTHHDPGPVNPPRYAAFLPHYGFRIVLGSKVRVLQPMRFLEHVFAENARIEPGSRDGTDEVEFARSDIFGKADRVAGSVDVDRDLRIRIGTKVVNGSQVINVRDFALQFAAFGSRDAKHGPCQVSSNWNQAVCTTAQFLFQPIQLVPGTAAYQYVNGGLPFAFE